MMKQTNPPDRVPTMDVFFNSNFQGEYIYGCFVIYWHEHSHYSVSFFYSVTKYFLLCAAYLSMK